jgi:transcriptional regulator with XRE-family HTH domain
MLLHGIRRSRLDEQSRTAAQLIGEHVRSRRIEGGLSEEAVARVLGCDIAHLEAAERGEINFTPEQVFELCTILRVTPSWFFEVLD